MATALEQTKKYLLSGVSYAIPFVACGGIMIATAIAFVPMTSAGPDFSGSPFLKLVLDIGSAAFSFLVPVLVFGDPRFKVPATPSFALLAGVAVVAVLDRLGRGADLPPDPRAGPATEDDGGQDRPAPASS